MKTEHPIPRHFGLLLAQQWKRLCAQLTSPWTKALVLVVLYLLLSRKELNLSVSIHGASLWTMTETAFIYDLGAKPSGKNVSQLTAYQPKASEKRVWTAKEQRQLAYVASYASIAQEEMKSSKIPASITLAQALLESNIGSSTLATKNNNHFGIKCFSKSCKKGHCSNFTDDSHKDFFLVFEDAQASFRAHSALLKKDRYAGLFRLSPTDYRGWARGLSDAGYATDPTYAEKLIHLIENLGLQQYDQLP